MMRAMVVPAIAKLVVVGALVLGGAAFATSTASADTTQADFQCASATGSGGDATGTDCTLKSGTPAIGSSAYIGDAAQAFVCGLDSYTDNGGVYDVTGSGCKKIH